MSKENASQFCDAMSKDKALLQQVIDLSTAADPGWHTKVLELGKERGLEFSKEEIAAELGLLAQEELSGEQLDAVAGGLQAPKITRRLKDLKVRSKAFKGSQMKDADWPAMPW